MTFQYFFFATVARIFFAGAALCAGGRGVVCPAAAQKEPALPGGQVVLRSLFPCYFAGLLVFTIFLYPVSDLYYLLFYGRPSQGGLPWFVMDYDFSFDFFRNFTTENRDNILLFLPFGLLYPLYRPQANWGRTVLAGLCATIAIELIQPIVGRSFDVDDILMNLFGTVISATLFFFCCGRYSAPKGSRHSPCTHSPPAA